MVVDKTKIVNQANTVDETKMHCKYCFFIFNTKNKSRFSSDRKLKLLKGHTPRLCVPVLSNEYLSN